MVGILSRFLFGVKGLFSEAMLLVSGRVYFFVCTVNPLTQNRSQKEELPYC